MYDRAYLICVPIHTDMLESQTRGGKKTCIVIVFVCLLINRHGSQVVEESLVVSECPRLINLSKPSGFSTCHRV